MLHFFVKLNPPRSGFAQDMSAEERKLMQEHASYWQNLQQKGFAIIYGPVMDPDGVYGMGVLQVEDEDQAKNLSQNDPVSKAKLLRYEIYPMKAIFKQLG